MPIYEYFCSTCSRVFEVMRSFAEAEEPALCPRCGGQGQKLISVFASKAGFYLGVPAKEAFRKLPQGKTAKKTKSTKRSKSG